MAWLKRIFKALKTVKQFDESDIGTIGEIKAPDGHVKCRVRIVGVENNGEGG